MAEQTLYFQNPRALAELYCGDDALLRQLETGFGVQVVTRDDWIQFAGADEGVAKATDLFDILRLAREQGIRITVSDYQNTFQEVAEGHAQELRRVFAEPLVLPFKRKSVVPKTINQKRYLQEIRDKEVVFGIGPAGTGKTYLAVAAALDALFNERVERIILTRPAVEAGEALGFLPGDLTEKILPYLLPLYDAIYDMLGQADGRRLIGMDQEKREGSERTSKIEIAPLAYMRGRTLSDAFVILDEAQNTTHEQMMMFLTRLGNNSRMVITGDKTQIDLPRSKVSGLREAERILQGTPGIKFHYFEGRDVVRNPIVQRIIDAYQRDAESQFPVARPARRTEATATQAGAVPDIT
ncbi:MAG: PhoH family protein [Verrucomicrobiota bacterium JB022]|nr:PhoH family protein [Verrucomicrobiota bacterium JB022]